LLTWDKVTANQFMKEADNCHTSDC
jgi:hypothetical protein